MILPGGRFMPIRIAICDDEKEIHKQLWDALLCFDSSFEIITYSLGSTLLSDFEENRLDVDLLFLDICMPELNGIQTAQRIRMVRKDLKIIFLTSSKDYYPQAFEVFAFNYLIKPIKPSTLYLVLEKALEDIRKERGYQIHIQYKGISHRIDSRKILYAESQNRLVLFHLTDGTMLQCYGIMENIANSVSDPFLFRCHQSYFINFAHVTEMGESYFRLGQTTIPISRKYIKEAKAKYYDCLFSQMKDAVTL